MIAIFIICFFFSLFSQNDTTSISNKVQLDTIKTTINIFDSVSKAKHIVTIGKVEYGVKIDSIPIWKVDAAMNLIGNLQNKFAYFPLQERLELIDSLRKNDVENPSTYVLDSLKINWLFNIKINKLQNILGVNLTAISLKDSSNLFSDNGFSYLNLRDSTEKNIYDIAITNALQRAISKTLNDSTLFKDAYKDYIIYPYPTLVVGGLEFKNNDIFSKWNIFSDKQVTSYDIAETIWEEAYNQDRFVVYDIESRDSLYTLFNMYGVENYDAPTPFEIKALNSLEVKYYITGTFERASPGAIIKIHICEVRDKHLKIITTGKEELKEDDLTELRKKIKSATKKAIDKFREING